MLLEQSNSFQKSLESPTRFQMP